MAVHLNHSALTQEIKYEPTVLHYEVTFTV